MKKTRARISGALLGTLAMVLAVGISAGELDAQQGEEAHAHIDHVLNGFGATPDGAGLLPVALEDARVAQQHADLAAGDPTNLDGMRRHAQHVLHAVAPGEAAEGGPGSGFGVKRAAEGIAQHVQLAADADGASPNVQTHARHVVAAARTVSQRADEIVEVVAEIEDAYDYTEASSRVRRLRTLANQLTAGVDASEDGEIGWQEGEGGLDHVKQHMGLMASGEGLD